MAFSGPLSAWCRSRATMGEDRSSHSLSKVESVGVGAVQKQVASRPPQPPTWGNQPSAHPALEEGERGLRSQGQHRDRQWRMHAWQVALGPWGPETGVMGAWHHAGAGGRKGKRSSRRLGMSHNYRRKIRPEPGSHCLCLSDHCPYYKATNY